VLVEALRYAAEHCAFPHGAVDVVVRGNRSTTDEAAWKELEGKFQWLSVPHVAPHSNQTLATRRVCAGPPARRAQPGFCSTRLVTAASESRADAMSLTAWAARKRESTVAPQPAPASESKLDVNSDSDDDGSTTSELSEATKAKFSPVAADLLTTIVVFGADGGASPQ
jgi:hypothetical protein